MSKYVNILQEIVQMHHTVSEVVDVVFINGVGLLVIISRNIKFTTLQYARKWMTSNLSK